MTSELAKRPRALTGQIVPRLSFLASGELPPVDFSHGLHGTVYPGVWAHTPKRPDFLARLLGPGAPDPATMERLGAIRDALGAAEFEPIRKLFESFGSDEIRAREAAQMIKAAIPEDINSLPVAQVQKTLKLVSYLATKCDPDKLEGPLRLVLKKESRTLLADRSQMEADLRFAQACAPELNAMSAAVTLLNSLDTPAVRLVRIIAEKASPEAKHGCLQSLVSCFGPYANAVRMEVVYAKLKIKSLNSQSDLQERFIESARSLRRIYLSIATGSDTDALMSYKEPRSYKERAQEYAAEGLPQLSQILTAGLDLAAEWQTKTVRPNYDVIARALMVQDPSLTRERALLAGFGL